MREPARRGCNVSAWGALVATAWLSAAAGAEDARGWHVVRPGDTLEGITARYLGSALEWRQNWALNPQVRDPDLLLPGERLRVLLRPSTSQPAAQLRNVRRQVDEMPAPIAWKPAADEDLLLMHDGVRTDYNKELRAQGIPIIALNMVGSITDAVDLVVSDPVQAGTMAVMAIADTATFDLARQRGRRY